MCILCCLPSLCNHLLSTVCTLSHSTLPGNSLCRTLCRCLSHSPVGMCLVGNGRMLPGHSTPGSTLAYTPCSHRTTPPQAGKYLDCMTRTRPCRHPCMFLLGTEHMSSWSLNTHTHTHKIIIIKLVRFITDNTHYLLQSTKCPLLHFLHVTRDLSDIDPWGHLTHSDIP